MNDEPAFPTEVWDSQGIPQHTQGMTLRDYFAAKAMQGLLANNGFGSDMSPDLFTKLCYGFADAMLRAREQ